MQDKYCSFLKVTTHKGWRILWEYETEKEI